VQPVFDPKHPRNHDKLFHGIKKPKNIALKTKLIPKSKINPSSDMFFYELLRYKNT
jgi:hypothetical protein